MFQKCRRPQGQRFTMGYPTPPSKVPSLSPIPAQLQGFTITTRWDSLCLPVSPLSGLWSVWSVVSPPGVCLLYTNCTGDLIRKLTPSISTGRGKGTQTRSLKWEWGSVTSFKHSWVCNPLSSQQSFKSTAKASGLCLDLELDPFVWQLQKPPVWEGMGQSTMYR